MTAQPEHPHAPQTELRVPHTINGIADALTGARRMEFYRAVGQAEAGPDLQHVIATWWGQAMLDTDPDRDRIKEVGGQPAARIRPHPLARPAQIPRLPPLAQPHTAVRAARPPDDVHSCFPSTRARLP